MRLTALFRAFRAWETAAQIGFLLAIILIIPALIMAIRAPSELRGLAVGSVMALVIAAQLIFMWANRTMVTPYTKAQRYYLAEDFEAARQLLEDLRETGKANVTALTLLGNTYRQLGLLTKSKAVLYEAIDIQPDLHFSLYGFGRTLLSEGHYADAITAIEQALANGGPSIIQFDLGEAFYRDGKTDQAIEALRQSLVLVEDEPHRALMARYMLSRLGVGETPSKELIRNGLAYWETSAARFADTPYGKALKDDIFIINAFTT